MLVDGDPEQFSSDDLAAALDLPPETMHRLRALDEILCEEIQRHNLIARSTLPSRWFRHFLDCAQLQRVLPQNVHHLVDIGSGAGFPGLVLASMPGLENTTVTLVESVGKKAAFLRTAATHMGLTNINVENTRLEAHSLAPAPTVLTARAVASLDRLCGYAAPYLADGGLCIFPKGARVDEELTEAREHWHMDVEQVPSMTSGDSSILLIRRLRSRKGKFR